MKKFEVVACAVMMTACVSRGKNVKGIITDATINTMTIVSHRHNFLYGRISSRDECRKN